MFVEKQVCTMKGATEFCSIPSPRGWNKFPKLNELHSKLFGEEFDNAHNAFADIEATKSVSLSWRNYPFYNLFFNFRILCNY